MKKEKLKSELDTTNRLMYEALEKVEKYELREIPKLERKIAELTEHNTILESRSQVASKSADYWQDKCDKLLELYQDNICNKNRGVSDNELYCMELVSYKNTVLNLLGLSEGDKGIDKIMQLLETEKVNAAANENIKHWIGLYEKSQEQVEELTQKNADLKKFNTNVLLDLSIARNAILGLDKEIAALEDKITKARKGLVTFSANDEIIHEERIEEYYRRDAEGFALEVPENLR